MNPGNEYLALAEFLRAKLATHAGVSALVAGRIYDSIAPQNAAFPLIVFSLQSSGELNALGDPSVSRIFLRPRVLVKAVVQATSYTPASAIAQQIDAALVGSEGSAGTPSVLIRFANREETFHLVENVEGKQYRHLGGIYRAFVQAP
jgi:hypothetical protein